MFSYPKSHRGMQCHVLHNPPVSSTWISYGLSHTRTHTHTPLVETRTAGSREGSEEAAADRCGWPHTSPSGR